MPNEERDEIDGADSTVTTWRPERDEQTIVHPLLDGAGVYLEELPDLT